MKLQPKLAAQYVLATVLERREQKGKSDGRLWVVYDVQPMGGDVTSLFYKPDEDPGFEVMKQVPVRVVFQRAREKKYAEYEMRVSELREDELSQLQSARKAA